jgi:hypothetical protein
MYFIDKKHEENYWDLMNHYHIFRGKDVQYEASIYVAAVPGIYEHIEWSKLDSNSPLFALMEWSDEEEKHVPSHPALTGATRRMVEFGLSLYNGYTVSVDEVFGSVSKEEWVNALFQAMYIRIRRNVLIPDIVG